MMNKNIDYILKEMSKGNLRKGLELFNILVNKLNQKVILLDNMKENDEKQKLRLSIRNEQKELLKVLNELIEIFDKSGKVK